MGHAVGKNSFRNLRREGILKPYASTALESQFSSSAEFDDLYSQLSDVQKDEFLRVASSYLFLVKKGDWHVNIEDCNPVIDYLTNSFKLVSLFSLIESLSSAKHQDFYAWLTKRNTDTFPIGDKEKLQKLHEEYKATFGSIKRCVAFFERLPPHRQSELCKGFRVQGQPADDIKEVARFLYDLRSKFAHEGEFALDISPVPILSTHKSKTTLTTLSMPTLLRAFEEGFVAYFRCQAVLQPG